MMKRSLPFQDDYSDTERRYQDEYSDTEREVTDARQLIRRYQDEYSDTERGVTDARQLIKHFQDDYSDTERGVTDARQLIKHSQDDYSDTEREVTDARQLIRRYQDEYSDTEREVPDARQFKSKNFKSISAIKQKTASPSRPRAEPWPAKRSRRPSPDNGHRNRQHDSARHHYGRSTPHDKHRSYERPFSRSPPPGIPCSSRDLSPPQCKVQQRKTQPARKETKPMSLKKCTKFHSKDLIDNKSKDNDGLRRFTLEGTKVVVSDTQHDVTEEGELPQVTLDGTKILVSNLHPIVNEDDIMELFSILGPIRRSRLIEPGKAEIVFVHRDCAMIASERYSGERLDGQVMQVTIVDQKVSASESTYSSIEDTEEVVRKRKFLELEPSTLRRALFGVGNTGTSRPVAFTVSV